jgi:hypothetical protein
LKNSCEHLFSAAKKHEIFELHTDESKWVKKKFEAPFFSLKASYGASRRKATNQ